MIEIIVNEDQYNELAKEGSLKMIRDTVCRSVPKQKKSKKPKYGPLEITNPSDSFSLGCGIKAGESRNIRWQPEVEPKQQNKKQPKKPRPRGGISVIALTVAYRPDKGHWEVCFIKQMASVPTVYLAPGLGHTQNASKAIQDAGQVPYDEDVAAMLDDEREAAREKRQRDAKHKPKLVKPQPEPEHTDEELDRIENIIADELAA